MILELIASCALVGLWTPPPGWTVQQVWVPNDPFGHGGMTCVQRGFNMDCTPEKQAGPSVTLKRTVKVGDKIEMPVGCTGEVTPKK